ncbi:MAG: nucleotidyltransferase family protein [Microbacterium sp.]
MWVATSFAVLDLRGWADNPSDAEIMLLPTHPAEPIGLAGPYADLWRRLVAGPVGDDGLSAEERDVVREYADSGIASDDPTHPARVRHLDGPWLSSPFHELLYGLIASVARGNGIEIVFVKGPMLHRQGLREREHSGDIDVWVDVAQMTRLADLLEEWGWARLPEHWEGSPLHHSITLTPGAWGCEIDLHRTMPGFAMPDDGSFARVIAHSETAEFAAVGARVPTAAAHAVIAALHLMRPQQGRALSEGNMREAVQTLVAAGEDALAFSGEARASASLESVLEEAFPTTAVRVDYLPPLNWRWRAEPNRLKRYVIMFRSAPIGAWPRMAYRSLWPDDLTAMRIDRYYGGTARTPFQARMKRLKRGVLQQLRPQRSSTVPSARP